MRAEVIIIIHSELYKEEEKKSIEIDVSVYSLHASDDLPLKQWQW